MKRIMIAVFALFSAGLSLAAPAHAQDSTETVNQLIIYGDDPCPQSSGDQITVCARKAEEERYRIPELLRESSSPQNDAWNNKVLAYETMGKNGTLSCSPVGGGGWTGCVRQMIDTAMAERDSDPSLRCSELIAEERAKRLATIDETAEEQQAEVEAEERRYFERLEQEAKTTEAQSSTSGD